jgi:hypothetical protein
MLDDNKFLRKSYKFAPPLFWYEVISVRLIITNKMHNVTGKNSLITWLAPYLSWISSMFCSFSSAFTIFAPMSAVRWAFSWFVLGFRAGLVLRFGSIISTSTSNNWLVRVWIISRVVSLLFIYFISSNLINFFEE